MANIASGYVSIKSTDKEFLDFKISKGCTLGFSAKRKVDKLLSLEKRNSEPPIRRLRVIITLLKNVCFIYLTRVTF